MPLPGRALRSGEGGALGCEVGAGAEVGAALLTGCEVGLVGDSCGDNRELISIILIYITPAFEDRAQECGYGAGYGQGAGPVKGPDAIQTTARGMRVWNDWLSGGMMGYAGGLGLVLGCLGESEGLAVARGLCWCAETKARDRAQTDVLEHGEAFTGRASEPE